MPRGVYDRTRARTAQDDLEDGMTHDDPLGRAAAREAGMPYDAYLEQLGDADDDGLPSREELMARLAELEATHSPAIDMDDIPPGLIVPVNMTPTIDLSRPEDAPDMPEGEWSRRHLLQFLARQPRSMVFVEKEGWEAKGVDTFQYVGYMGHGFRVRKGRPESVPIQIAAIIEQSQEEFPTAQSQSKRRALTNIMDLPPSPGSLGVPGVETYLER